MDDGDDDDDDDDITWSVFLTLPESPGLSLIILRRHRRGHRIRLHRGFRVGAAF